MQGERSNQDHRGLLGQYCQRREPAACSAPPHRVAAATAEIGQPGTGHRGENPEHTQRVSSGQVERVAGQVCASDEHGDRANGGHERA